MIDFKIQRGSSDLIFLEPGVINPRLIIEDGCWYLCTDTAELFLGVQSEDGLTLKRINAGSQTDITIDPEVLSALRAELNAIKESLGNYATEQYVIDAIENHETLAAIEEVKTKLETEVLPIIPTVKKVETEIIPTVQELTEKAATQGWVADQKYLQTETFNTAIATKAEEVPFTADKFVTKPIGDFNVGDSVKGLTIAQIFAKLLGLSDEPSTEPDIPEQPGDDATPEEIVDYLIATGATMYSQDEQGNLVETPFASIAWTEAEAAAQMNGISTIYTITDESGDIVESGYQEATDYNEEAWLTVALPSEIKNVKVKMYDPDVNDWVDMLWKVVPAEEQTMDGYTIWTVPEQYEVTSGDTYRFVII